MATNEVEKTLIERLKAGITNHSEAERRVIRWVIDNPKEALDLSITDMATTCRVSEATVVRACQRLGFPGYADFKIALAVDISRTEDLVALGSVDIGDPVSAIVSKVFRLQMMAMKKTLDNLDMEEFERAVDAIAQARKVEIFSYGTHAGMAHDMATKLINAGVLSNARTDQHVHLMASATLENSDVLLVLTHSGRPTALLQAVQQAKALGATTIVITDDGESPIAKVADMALCAYGEDKVFYSTPTVSRGAKTALIDSLVVGVASRRPDEVIPNLFATQRAVQSLMTY